MDATTWKDKTGGNGSASGDATVTASGANTTTNGVAIGLAMVDGTSSDIGIDATPPSGYTNITFYNNANSIVGHSFVYKIYSASETSAASWTHDNTGQTGWEAAIVTYKAAAGGAIDLVVADASSVSQADAPVLVQVHNISVADGSSTSQADAITLVYLTAIRPVSDAYVGAWTRVGV
jgi:hypothetical protein